MSPTLPALSGLAQHLALEGSKNLGSAAHARSAAGILFHPEARGKRQAAVALGVAERTVERMLPWTEGEVLGWVRCVEQGTVGPEVEEARKTRWEVVQPDRTEVPQLEVLPLVVVLDQEEVPPGLDRDLAHARATGAPPSGWESQVLDPSLDCWADPQGRRDGLRCCGTEGWALTLLAMHGHVGTQEADGRLVVLTAAEVGEVAGLSERRARDLMRRMADCLVATRERGRLVFMPEALTMGQLAPNDRAVRMQERHQREERAYRSTEAVREKYDRREYLALTAHYNPGMTAEELAASWDQLLASRARTREAMVASMQSVWDEEDAAGRRPVAEPPHPDPDREAAFAAFLSRVHAGR